MSKIYVNQEPITDVTERLVLESLARTEVVDGNSQADKIRLCHLIFNSDTNKKKRADFNRLTEYYKDNQQDLFIQHVLRPLLGKDINGAYNYDKMVQAGIKPIVKVVNLLRRFVDKQAVLYDEKPTRYVITDGVVNDEATEIYNRISMAAGLDRSLQYMQRQQVLLRSCFIRPVVREYNGKQELCYDILTPAFIYAIPDKMDASRAVAYFWLQYDPMHPNDEYYATWYYLDSTSFFWWSWRSNDRLRIEGTAIAGKTYQYNAYISEYGDEQERGINPLGELGVVGVYSDIVPTETIPACGDSLINFQDNINIVETMKQNSLIYQGFPITHLHNFDSRDANGNPRQISVGPWSVIYSSGLSGESEPKVEFISPASNMGQFIETIRHDTDQFLLSAGVPKNVIIDASTSGAALAERNRDINELRKAQRERWARAEQEIYRLTAKIYNTWLRNGGAELPEDAILQIDYAEMGTIEETETARLDGWQKKFDLGVASAYDYFKAENPDITDQQIDEKLARIRQERIKSKSLLGSAIFEAVNRETENGG